MFKSQESYETKGIFKFQKFYEMERYLENFEMTRKPISSTISEAETVGFRFFKTVSSSSSPCSNAQCVLHISWSFGWGWNMAAMNTKFIYFGNNIDEIQNIQSLTFVSHMNLKQVCKQSLNCVLFFLGFGFFRKEFGDVAFVQRLATSAGLPPISKKGAKVGDVRKSKYSAVYAFYVPS